MSGHSTAKSSIFGGLPSPFKDRRKKCIFSSARLAQRVKSIKERRESCSNPSSPTLHKKKHMKKSYTPPFLATITVTPGGSEKSLSGNFLSSPTETRYDFTPSITPTQLSQPESIGLIEVPNSSTPTPSSPLLKKSHTPPFPATIVDPPSDNEEHLSSSFPPFETREYLETPVTEKRLLKPQGLKDVPSKASVLSDDSGYQLNPESSTSSLLSVHQCQSRRHSLPLSDSHHCMRKAYSSASCGTRRGSIPYPPPIKSPQRTSTKWYRAIPRKYLPKNAHATSALHVVCVRPKTL